MFAKLPKTLPPGTEIATLCDRWRVVATFNMREDFTHDGWFVSDVHLSVQHAATNIEFFNDIELEVPVNLDGSNTFAASILNSRLPSLIETAEALFAELVTC